MSGNSDFYVFVRVIVSRFVDPSGVVCLVLFICLFFSPNSYLKHSRSEFSPVRCSGKFWVPVVPVKYQ